MKTYERITDLIGGTPLLKLTNYIRDNGLQAGNRAKHFRTAGLHSRLDLGESREGNFLLAAAGRLFLRQGREEAEPVQRVFFRDFQCSGHSRTSPSKCCIIVSNS